MRRRHGGLGIKAGLSRWRATRQSRESEMV